MSSNGTVKPPIGSPVQSSKSPVQPEEVWIPHTNPMLEVEKNSGKLRTRKNLSVTEIDKYYDLKPRPTT